MGTPQSELNERLLRAIHSEHVVEAKAALRDGASANAVDESFDSSALNLAAIAGNSILVYHLLKHGAKIDTRNVFDSSPMHRVADHLFLGAADMLIWSGGYRHLQDADNNQQTPFDLLRKKAVQMQNKPDERARAEKLMRHFTRFQERPKVEDWSTVTHLDLLSPTGQNRFALLDYPETWEHFDTIADAMEAAGTPITKQDLLRPGSTDEPFLVNGIKAMQWTKLCHYLQAHGDGLTADDFLDAQQEPTPLLDFFIEHMALEDVFTHDVWSGRPMHEIKRVYHALTEFEQEQVTNLHSLLAGARPLQQRTAGMGN